MALDGMFLHGLCAELQIELLDTRVEKIYQPSREALIFLMRGRGGAKRLLFTSKADSPRVHMTSDTPENPKNPPMLCMLFRKHLNGAKLKAIRQPELERILFFDFEATNELGDLCRITLCIEIMARHSNLILMDADGKILDSVKRVGETTSSVREILPGLLYEMPPKQEKLCLLEADVEAVLDAIRQDPNRMLAKSLQTALQGISPLVSREIAHKAGGDRPVYELDESGWNQLRARLCDLKEQLTAGTVVPMLLKEPEGKPKFFSFLELTQYGSALEPVPQVSLSALLDAFYTERDRVERNKQRTHELSKRVANGMERLAKKIHLQMEELKRCEDKDLLREQADLIHANMHALEKGSMWYELEDFYHGMEQRRIQADPALSPAQNAQKYYKAYRKAQTAEQMLEGFIEDAKKELAYLESVQDLLSRADTSAELDEIRSELVQQGYVKQKRAGKQKQPKALPPLKFQTDGGFQVLVGRNNLQNDQLTLKQASKQDVWFHVKNIHGSHVILNTQGKEPDETDLRQAAMLAAYHSKARDSAQVPVDYAPVRNVKKPGGAKPGRVIYENYNTVYVTPDEALVSRLKLEV